MAAGCLRRSLLIGRLHLRDRGRKPLVPPRYTCAMHAIDGMACAKRGCDNRGKLGLNIVGHGSFPTKWGRRWRYRCTVCGGPVSRHCQSKSA